MDPLIHHEPGASVTSARSIATPLSINVGLYPGPFAFSVESGVLCKFSLPISKWVEAILVLAGSSHNSKLS